MLVTVRITAFEVPADGDEAFLAAWSSRPAATLHRALRSDVDFRFVDIAQGDPPERPISFPAHTGRYEVAHEEGDVEGSGGVVLINAFEVPEGADDAFLEAWEQARAVLADRQGYIGTRLLRSVGQADFRFVNVARWSSPLMFARALQLPAFQRAAQAMGFASHPALYEIVER